jgi:hypothetical protein
MTVGSLFLYQLSGVTVGPQNVSGYRGMPFDLFKNTALIDTGETNHVALLLSAIAGSQTLNLAR